MSSVPKSIDLDMKNLMASIIFLADIESIYDKIETVKGSHNDE